MTVLEGQNFNSNRRSIWGREYLRDCIGQELFQQSGAVTVTFPTGYEPATSQGPGAVTGTMAGIQGVVNVQYFQATTFYTFSAVASNNPVTVTGSTFDS